ncbi:MAG: urate hydroxylase PuuD [Porticoccaceae bacterium]|nr:urate hydroxylase PuuD [Porticoccaceae bacterium]
MSDIISMNFLNFLFRWGHLLFGITWIGMLYYFNFVQGAYFKEGSAEAVADAKKKLAPRALWWFRWGAMFTFITGVVLLGGVMHNNGQSLLNDYIVIGAVLGTLMFLNVWLVIWPNQQVALGTKEGDGPVAGAKALLASRTNVLFSAPMAFAMLASPHLGYSSGHLLSQLGGGLGMYIALAIIALLEINALIGKQGPLTTVKGVIHCSIGLTVVLVAVLKLL